MTNINDEFKRLLGVWLQKKLKLDETPKVVDYEEHYKSDTGGPYGCETCGYGADDDAITEVYIDYIPAGMKRPQSYMFDGTTGDLIKELSDL